MTSRFPGASAHQAQLGGTVGGMFHDAVLNGPDAVALRTGSTQLSYRELNTAVNRLAHAMRQAGLVRGDRIAILSENSLAYVQTMLACAKLGVIAACLNWRQEAEEISHCLALTTPRCIFVSEQFAGLLQAASTEQTRVIVYGEPFERFTATGIDDEPDAEVETEDGLLILYTSGTTGRPKGAVVSHRAMIARGLLMRADWHVRRTDGFIAWAPLFHMASADPTLSSLVQGSTVTVLPGFEPEGIAEALTVHDVGWMVLMPGMIERLADVLDGQQKPLKRVAAAGCMANLVPGEQIARISALLDAPFLNSFGSTETGIPPGSGNWIPPGEVPSSLGKLQCTGCEIRLLDEHGKQVEPGEPGEICLRSPALFSGYWADPEATAKAFAGGWYHMGDDFSRDASGLLHFADRRKYLIKSGGENIYPAEIELLLRNHPGVEDAVVVRRADPTWGEVPVAFVVPAREPLTEAELLDALKGRIARYKLPKQFHFIGSDEIERNATGKIRRDLLEKRAAAHQAEAQPG